MFKKIIWIGLFTALVALLVVGAVNRTQAKNESEEGSVEHSEHGLASGADLLPAPAVHAPETSAAAAGSPAANHSEPEAAPSASAPGTGLSEFNPAGTSDITAEEIAALIFMREEEKLAHDIYQAMYELWGKPIFQNISRSEQTHTDAVQAVLDSYHIPDPASDQPGVFSNPDLQALYDTLLAQGSQSQSEALRVGAAIEEIDILDLQTRLAQTINPDIQQVFNSLLLGSANHLKAFSTMLAVETGTDYQPQVLSPETYQAYIAQAGAGSGQGRGAGNGRWAAP